MSRSYGDPPQIKKQFDSKDDEIEYLVDQAIYWFWKPDILQARDYAEQLARLLDETEKDEVSHSEEWAAVWEARGNTSEAIRCADISITRSKTMLLACDESDRRSEWFHDEVRSLQEALYLQACRHVRLGDRTKAKQRMIEASELARFGPRLDEDEEELLRELASDVVDNAWRPARSENGERGKGHWNKEAKGSAPPDNALGGM